MNKQVKVAKELAKQIVAALSKNGQELSHGVALEVVAKAMGARNWHAYQAEQQVVPQAVAPQAVTSRWSPAHGPMSDTQYVATGGNACPVCGSKHYVEAEDAEADGDSASCKVDCVNCGSSWTDVYTLSGISDLDPGFYAEENKLVYALELWLTEGGATLSDERQEALDELVHENVQAYRSLVRARFLNQAVSAREQEDIIEDAQAFASNINNGGLHAQLRFLAKMYKSEDEFINDLAKECEISRDTLNH